MPAAQLSDSCHSAAAWLPPIALILPWAALQALAQEVACFLGIDLGGIKIKRFADGEIYVQIMVRLPSCLQLAGRLHLLHYWRAN